MSVLIHTCCCSCLYTCTYMFVYKVSMGYHMEGNFGSGKIWRIYEHIGKRKFGKFVQFPERKYLRKYIP